MKKYTNKTDPPRYNWIIVESGVKHHKPNQTNQLKFCDMFLFKKHW